MPHAMTDAFSVDDTLTDAPARIAPVEPVSVPSRQHESETPNERAMRAATAARRKAEPAKRQQG